MQHALWPRAYLGKHEEFRFLLVELLMPEKGLVLAAAATAEDWKACIGIGSLLQSTLSGSPQTTLGGWGHRRTLYALGPTPYGLG